MTLLLDLLTCLAALALWGYIFMGLTLHDMAYPYPPRKWRFVSLWPLTPFYDSSNKHLRRVSRYVWKNN